MTGASQRLLGQGRNTAQEVADLLEWMWLAELLAPGEELWVIAPIIDNAPLLDNSTGAFDALDPGWGRRPVRLIDLLLRLAASGQRIVLGSVQFGARHGFLEELRTTTRDRGLEELLRVHELPWLSASGILTSHGVLRGEVELAFQGVRLGSRTAVFDTQPRVLQEARAAFRDSLAPGAKP